MAAEALGMASAIGSILQAVSAVAKQIQSIYNAPTEARQVQNELSAITSILSSLESTLKRHDGVEREFKRTWAASTNLVLDNIALTVGDVNKKLGSPRPSAVSRSSLSIAGLVWKVKWALSKDDGARLLQQLRGYVLMLGLSQNALLQESVHELIRSTTQIRDTIAGNPNYPLSSSASSRVDSSIASISSSSGFSDVSTVVNSSASPPTVENPPAFELTLDVPSFEVLNYDKDRRRVLGPGRLRFSKREEKIDMEFQPKDAPSLSSSFTCKTSTLFIFLHLTAYEIRYSNCEYRS